jgi:hypothetical protein
LIGGHQQEDIRRDINTLLEACGDDWADRVHRIAIDRVGCWKQLNAVDCGFLTYFNLA